MRRIPVTFRDTLTRRYSLRLHMFGILLLTLLTAAAANYALLHLGGLRSLQWRYPLAALCAYAGFFAWIRIWLALVLPSRKSESGSRLDGDDVLDILDFGGSSGSSGGTGSASWGGGGGKFGGGGATSSFGESAADREMLLMAAPRAGSPELGSESSKLGLPDLDLGDSDELAVIVVGIALLLAVVGAAGYVIYVSPDLLSDAAVQAGLASGALYPNRKRLAIWWQHGVLRRTVWPFVAVLVLCFLFGRTLESSCPGADRFSQWYRGECGAKNEP